MRQKERELAPCHCRPWSHEPHHCRRGRKEHELEEPLKKLSAVRQRSDQSRGKSLEKYIYIFF
ncbi:uncharacterized protein DS421_7g207080 [Arachis hypogaea]|nr:uncharacterized protein DS421_7g207080 [Arachis hypogaea]